jgi:hypothetical protein
MGIGNPITWMTRQKTPPWFEVQQMEFHIRRCWYGYVETNTVEALKIPSTGHIHRGKA